MYEITNDYLEIYISNQKQSSRIVIRKISSGLAIKGNIKAQGLKKPELKRSYFLLNCETP